jgi:hypothetical protein
MMNNKSQLIETPDYILAVSDEEIKPLDWVHDPIQNRAAQIHIVSKKGENFGAKKIIAYQPKGNAPELDLPLLPSLKKEIVGYKLKPNIDRLMVDSVLKHPMPIWNDEDKSVYFIRGHVGGSLVARLKELQVLDLWFTPIYEEVKSGWVKEHHLEHYYKEGLMKDEIVVKDDVEKLAEKLFPMNMIGGGISKSDRQLQQNAFKKGYKAATKVYSEEDLRKAIEMARVTVEYPETETCFRYRIFEITQSLKQSKPKWFIVEMECGEIRQCMCEINDDCLKPELKTTTINGKEYLVGTYLFE